MFSTTEKTSRKYTDTLTHHAIELTLVFLTVAFMKHHFLTVAKNDPAYEFVVTTPGPIGYYVHDVETLMVIDAFMAGLAAVIAFFLLGRTCKWIAGQFVSLRG